jgi:hypothetical protein
VAQKVVSTYVYHFIDIGLSFIYQWQSHENKYFEILRVL